MSLLAYDERGSVVVRVVICFVRRYLAHMYAAEALCALGRVKEAADLMAPMEPQNPPLEDLLLDHDSSADLSPSQLTYVARTVNTAVVQAVQGELEDARMTLESALDISPSYPEGLRCMIYILLRQGKASEALNILRHERYPS